MHNSDGEDVSDLPSIANVLRIRQERKVTEWYTPGDRTTKHTSGPKIGTMEYKLCFMDMTRETWVPSEWFADLQAPHARMLLDDMNERMAAEEKFQPIVQA